MLGIIQIIERCSKLEANRPTLRVPKNYIVLQFQIGIPSPTLSGSWTISINVGIIKTHNTYNFDCLIKCGQSVHAKIHKNVRNSSPPRQKINKKSVNW